jgi:type III pantothenate kinase
MLLVIDVGNSNIVYGLFEGEVLREQYRVESSLGRTSDEYAVVLRELLAIRGIQASVVTEAIVASVVPRLTHPMVALVRRVFAIEAVVVGPGTKTGMAILCENPEQIGVDRIVNAVAAYETRRAGLIAIDLGTATTFDCVTPAGEYLGGAIAAGLQISADALFSRAARLPRVEIKAPPNVVGRNTVHAMQSGLLYGYVGLVDGLVVRLQDELQFPCTVIATGGLASLVGPLSKTITEVDDTLTLRGLRILYERNR